MLNFSLLIDRSDGSKNLKCLEVRNEQLLTVFNLF